MWILFNLFLAFLPPSWATREVPLSEIRQLYSHIPGAYLISRESHDLEDPRFIELNDTFYPKGISSSNHDYTQGLFETDVLAYNSAQDAPDFLGAKETFYSRLKFFPELQKHERPYPYLNGWLSLNHSPLKVLSLPLNAYVSQFGTPPEASVPSDYFSTDFQTEMDQTTGTGLTFENELHLLQNGSAIKEKIRLVQEAKSYVLAAVMAVSCDPSSMPLIEAMIQKARSGIPVYLMIERFYGATLFKGCARRMKREGVRVLEVNDKWKKQSLYSFFHAKFWVTDHQEAIIGGQNVASFENLSTGYNQFNRDTDIRVQGPAATDLALEFFRIWSEHQIPDETLIHIHEEARNKVEIQKRGHLRGRENYAEVLNSQTSRMNGVCRVLVQSPYNRNLSIAKVLETHIAHARHSIFLTTPEVKFSLDHEKTTPLDSFYETLKERARSGVPVEFLSNGLDGGNGELTAALRMGLEHALTYGLRLKALFYQHILSFEPRNNARDHRNYLVDLHRTPNLRTWTHFNYIHAKQAYLDRIVTVVSSLNLDLPSVERNTEAGIVCMDERLSKEMEPQLALDLGNSVPVTSANEFHPPTRLTREQPGERN
jgi:phosphatidylserine/phosphatidylglycerophosphate/cardiolipin synthase-like enzyme